MNFKRNILSISTSIAMLSMVGCGVTSQDEGVGGSRIKLSGIAVDGYVAGGVVFADTNGNFKLDVWETRALTDERGYFTYSPEVKDLAGEISKEAIAYCDLAKTDFRYQHCLTFPVGYDEVMIRITKGIDLSTGTDFVGFISMKAGSDADITNLNVVSPISSLLAEMTDVEKAAFLLREGIPDFDGIDFLNLDPGNALEGKEDQRDKIVGLALVMHNISNVGTDFISGELDQALAKSRNKSVADDGTVTPRFSKSDTIVITRQSVLTALLALSKDNSGSSLTDVLKDSTKVKKFLSDAQAEMKVIGSLNGVDDLDSINDTDVSSTATGIVDITLVAQNALAGNAAAVAAAQAAVDAARAAYTGLGEYSAQLAAVLTAEEALRAVRSSVQKVTELAKKLVSTGASTTVMDNLKDLSKEVAFLDNVAGDKTDVDDLKDELVAANGNGTAATADYSARQCFPELLADTGNTTGISATDGDSVNTLGFAKNTLGFSEKDSNGAVTNSIKIDFFGDGDSADVTHGKMDLFATFADGEFAKKDASGNPEAQLFQGNWNQLNKCTLQVTIEVAGAKKAVTVKPKLFLVDSVKTTGFSFDLDGESATWIP